MRAFGAWGVAALVAAQMIAAPASAERRTFIIPNNADGYGVDRCLAAGDRCGTPVATAYCQSQSFTSASSFGKIDRDEITGAVPTSGTNSCPGGVCDNFVAIVCQR